MSSCGCIISEPDWVAYDYEETEQVATVDLLCSECGATIKPKDQYILAKYTDEDEELYSREICIDCHSVIDEFFCDGYTFGQVWEDMWEHTCGTGGTISSSCLLSLTPKARKKVIGLIDELWEDDFFGKNLIRRAP
jgi:hypothetical protein